MDTRDMFYGLVAGQFLISLVFLGQRLINGMPFFEAFGKFWFAFLLGVFVVMAALGIATFIVGLFTKKR